MSAPRIANCRLADTDVARHLKVRLAVVGTWGRKTVDANRKAGRVWPTYTVGRFRDNDGWREEVVQSFNFNSIQYRPVSLPTFISLWVVGN